MYQQAGSKAGAWLDRHVPFIKKAWKAFSMLGDITKVVTGGVAFAALILGGNAAYDAAVVNTSGPCPDGWSYNYAVEGDAVHQSCYKSPWSVVLNPDKTCNYGLDTTNPNAQPIPCEDVPNWAGS